MRTPVRGVMARRATLIEGPAGWGESSPLPGYPVPRSSCDTAAIEAAVLGLPDPVRHTVPVNALIPDEDTASAVDRAERAVEAGYRTLKVKVGDDGDAERVAAIRRAVGDTIAMRLDANGMWDPAIARDRVQRLAEFDPEFIEEPVNGLEQLARLRQDVTVKLAADESVRSHADAQRLATLGAVDVLILKVQACGGALRALRWAEDAEVPVVVTSMLETSVGIAAGVALAAALPQLPYACGLATAGLLAADVVAEPLLADGGTIAVRQVVPEPGLLARYSVGEPN
jgi:O-succinylbenzoate synthase